MYRRVAVEPAVVSLVDDGTTRDKMQAPRRRQGVGRAEGRWRRGLVKFGEVVVRQRTVKLVRQREGERRYRYRAKERFGFAENEIRGHEAMTPGSWHQYSYSRSKDEVRGTTFGRLQCRMVQQACGGGYGLGGGDGEGEVHNAVSGPSFAGLRALTLGVPGA